MDLAHIPLFDALAKRMAWLSDRQAVLAENVANADTPGYVPKDLKPLDFRNYLRTATSSVALATTQPGHIAVKRDIADTAVERMRGDSGIDGNRVSAEEEMMKVSQTANDFALTSTLYKANLGIVKTVLGRTS